MKFLEALGRRFSVNVLWKNILLISSGTAIAQAVTIAVTPIVTRLFEPSDYGILSSFNSIIAVLVIIGSFDYHKAIPLAKDNKEAVNLLVLSLLILFSIMFLIFLGLYICGETIFSSLEIHDLWNFRVYLPVAFLLIGTYKILLEYAIRNRNYAVITQTTIYQSVVANVCRVILGYFGVGALGLILSSIMGKSGGIYKLTKPFVSIKGVYNQINKNSIWDLIHRYRRYPLYSTPSNLIYTLGNNLPMLFLLAFFGSSEVGLFGLATNIINIPISLVGISVSQVFFAEAAKIGKHKPKELKDLSTKLVLKLATFGVIPLLVVFIYGPQMFSFIFGNQWYVAGIYARILSVMIYFHLLILPIGRLLEILELQRLGLIFNVIRLACISLVFYGTWKLDISSINTIVSFVIVNSIFFLSLLLWVLKILRRKSLIQVEL